MNIRKLFTRRGSNTDNPDLQSIINLRMSVAWKEFEMGYNLIKKHPKTVSILGSARFDENNKYYKLAREVAGAVVKELGYTIVTGGGPGIMEAASRGAHDFGGKAIGFTIKLPKEQSPNSYLDEYVEFEYFFSRKTLIFFSAETYIYFPGGFGTIDELMEVLTLMQTGKITRVPVILVGRDFWEPILKLIEDKLYIENKTISEDDLKLYQICDSPEEIVKIIKDVPLRKYD